jgi:MFS family permease
VIAETVNEPLNTVISVTGYNLFMAGCVGPFVSALSRKYGKRPLYIGSALTCIIGTAVGEAKISYSYLAAARIVQGISTSAFESLINATIGDLFFVHERSPRIATFNFFVLTASCLASMICGVVFTNLGWLWLFHLFQIFLVIQFILMFLLCPETTYIRDTRYETDLAVDEKLEELAHIEDKNRLNLHATVTGEDGTRIPASTLEPKKTFVQELAIFTGKYHNDYIFLDIAGPFLTLLNPAACYAIIGSALLNSWYVGSSIILSLVFSGPPWHFDAAHVGYTTAGPLIGGVIASITVAVVGDPVIKYLSVRNKGI